MKAQYIHAIHGEANELVGVSLSGETYKILPLSDTSWSGSRQPMIDIDQL